MKKRLLVSALVLSAVSAASSFAQDAQYSSLDSLVPLSWQANARVGMTRTELVDQLGEPSQKISAVLWVYSDFRARYRPIDDRADALVVIFVGERVSLLRLTERSLIEAALVKARVNANKAAAVAQN